MSNKKQKSLIISTLVLFLGIGVVALYSFMPNSDPKQEVLDTYKVIFDTNGGNSIAAIEIEEWNSTNLPEDPTREGYIFIGWMLGDELYDFSKGVSEDITLRAGWKEIEPDKTYYTVVFNTDGGTTYANQVVEEGTPVTRPETYPTKDGFTFVGWQVDGIEYNFNSPVTSDLTINAVWEQNQADEPGEQEDPNRTYTVTFRLNGGTAGGNCNNQTVKVNTKANNTCTPTMAGYRFTGWSPNINRNITADTTFTAQWELIPVSVSASFCTNFGAGTCTTKTVNERTTIAGASVSSPSRQYYRFAGWATSPNGAVVPNTTQITSSVRAFYAVWELNSFSATCDATGIASLNPNCKLIVKDSTGTAYNGSYTVTWSGGEASRTGVTNGTQLPIKKAGGYTVIISVDGKNVSINGTVVGL